MNRAMKLFGVLLTLGAAFLPVSLGAASPVRIVAGPNPSAADAPITITVRGLKPHSTVQLKMSRQRFNYPMQSQAMFAADAAGVVDASLQAPITGDYQHRDPMGLFWSLRPVNPSQPFNDKPGDEIKSFDVSFVAYQGSRAVARATS